MLAQKTEVEEVGDERENDEDKELEAHDMERLQALVQLELPRIEDRKLPRRDQEGSRRILRDLEAEQLSAEIAPEPHSGPAPRPSGSIEPLSAKCSSAKASVAALSGKVSSSGSRNEPRPSGQPAASVVPVLSIGSQNPFHRNFAMK